jgi:Ras-related protein Rab-39B
MFLLVPSCIQVVHLAPIVCVLFRSITKSYYRNSVGILLVYDITNRRSFEHLESWMSEAQLHIDSRRAVYIIVGHKADRDSERAITTREGRNFAQFHGARYLETSAKTGQNIEDVFLTITRDIYEMLECGHLYVEDGWDGIKAGYAHPRDSFTVTPEEQSSSGGCC